MYSTLLSKKLNEQRKHISETRTEELQDRARRVKRPTEGKMVCLLFSEGSERGGVGASGGGRWVCIINQAALPGVGTCKSGERRMGTQPNDSSTVLYKYCCTGSARLLLPVAKKPRDTGVSPSGRKVFNNLLIFFQSNPDL